jgi:hypothetical protein
MNERPLSEECTVALVKLRVMGTKPYWIHLIRSHAEKMDAGMAECYLNNMLRAKQEKPHLWEAP